jgi:hypothetical protein
MPSITTLHSLQELADKISKTKDVNGNLDPMVCLHEYALGINKFLPVCVHFANVTSKVMQTMQLSKF